ncbi:MAG: hypothetical protein H7Z14_18415 [Anaerolineae bacterium]|nr:hypothetical protein [Phycisphaerae bacterium]
MQLRGRSARTALACALIYGAAMGCSDARPIQILYSAIKLPLLLSVTFVFCLPSFFVINTVVGVRQDFLRVLRALLASQASITVALCSFAPLTLFWYLSTGNHELHILFNVIAFGVASVAGQVVLRRHYAPLTASAPVHTKLLKLWLIVFSFVGIQAAWVLRPFIGDPTRGTQFMRDDPWTNAYVWLARMIGRVIFS